MVVWCVLVFLSQNTICKMPGQGLHCLSYGCREFNMGGGGVKGRAQNIPAHTGNSSGSGLPSLEISQWSCIPPSLKRLKTRLCTWLDGTSFKIFPSMNTVEANALLGIFPSLGTSHDLVITTAQLRTESRMIENLMKLQVPRKNHFLSLLPLKLRSLMCCLWSHYIAGSLLTSY